MDYWDFTERLKAMELENEIRQAVDEAKRKTEGTRMTDGFLTNARQEMPTAVPIFPPTPLPSCGVGGPHGEMLMVDGRLYSLMDAELFMLTCRSMITIAKRNRDRAANGLAGSSHPQFAHKGI